LSDLRRALKKSAHALTVVLDAVVETLLVSGFASSSVVFEIFPELTEAEVDVMALCLAITEDIKDMVERLVVIVEPDAATDDSVSCCSTTLSCSLDISSIGLGVLMSELASTTWVILLQIKDNFVPFIFSLDCSLDDLHASTFIGLLLEEFVSSFFSNVSFGVSSIMKGVVDVMSLGDSGTISKGSSEVEEEEEE
jgi:hypothetical protein